jgi:hypothetical protein
LIKSVKFFRHFGGANQIAIVAQADDRLAIGRPQRSVLIDFFLRISGVIPEVRGKVWHQELVVAHYHQCRRRGLYQISKIASRLRLGKNSAGKVIAARPIGFHFDAGISGFEDIGDIAVRGETGVPDQLRFLFRASLEHLFAVSAAIVGEIGDGLRLSGGERRYKKNKRDK